jgi:putative transposase
VDQRLLILPEAVSELCYARTRQQLVQTTGSVDCGLLALVGRCHVHTVGPQPTATSSRAAAPSRYRRVTGLTAGPSPPSDIFPWYNTEHHHVGLGLLTPADVHHGLAEQRVAARALVLATAYSAHPERFSAGPPAPAAMPTEVWINPPQAQRARGGGADSLNSRPD